MTIMSPGRAHQVHHVGVNGLLGGEMICYKLYIEISQLYDIKTCHILSGGACAATLVGKEVKAGESNVSWEAGWAYCSIYLCSGRQVGHIVAYNSIWCDTGIQEGRMCSGWQVRHIVAYIVAYGMVWYGMVWYGMGWYGMVW